MNDFFVRSKICPSSFFLQDIWPFNFTAADQGLFALQVIVKWRGKPVFIRHRTSDEIKEAEDTKWETLRDPQPDSDRVQKPEWLIMLGMAISPFASLSPSYILLSLLRHIWNERKKIPPSGRNWNDLGNTNTYSCEQAFAHI